MNFSKWKRKRFSQVKEPTDWCAGMVFAPKSGESVWTKFNQNVQCERLMLPSVEQTL